MRSDWDVKARCTKSKEYTQLVDPVCTMHLMYSINKFLRQIEPYPKVFSSASRLLKDRSQGFWLPSLRDGPWHHELEIKSNVIWWRHDQSEPLAVS